MPACSPVVSDSIGTDAVDAAPWSMADEIASQIRLPDISTSRFDITDFGAVPDDGQDDRP